MAKVLKSINLKLESNDEGVTYQLSAYSYVSDSVDQSLTKCVVVQAPVDETLEQKIKDVVAALAAKAKTDESIS